MGIVRYAALTLVALSVVLAFAGRARAAASDANEERARELFQRSEISYREGRFREAAGLLREAYRLHPAPTLLYNLARALEGDGDLSGAVGAYRQYLREEKQVIDRGAIERRIQSLEGQLQERERLARERGEAEQARREAEGRLQTMIQHPPAPPPPPRRPSAAPWVVALVGSALVVAGVTLGALALSKHNDAGAASSQAEAASLQSDAHDMALGADATLITGGALTAGGLIWGALDRHRATAPAQNGR